MKSLPEHACDECRSMIQAIQDLKHELQRVKRLPFAEMPAEINALQAQAGSLEARAVELKTFVTVAFATHPPHERTAELQQLIQLRTQSYQATEPFTLSAA